MAETQCQLYDSEKRGSEYPEPLPLAPAPRGAYSLGSLYMQGPELVPVLSFPVGSLVSPLLARGGKEPWPLPSVSNSFGSREGHCLLLLSKCVRDGTDWGSSG